MSHSQDIVQAFFISSNKQAPAVLLCRDVCGIIHIWSIQEKVFLAGGSSRVDIMEPSICSISQELACSSAGRGTSSNSGGLIATQLKSKQQKGYLAFAMKDIFEFYYIQYNGATSTTNPASSKSCVYMKRVLTINQVHTSTEPLALSFIHDNNRLCILVTREDIIIIDCLQKCVVKKVKSQTDSFSCRHMTRAHIGMLMNKEIFHNHV